MSMDAEFRVFLKRFDGFLARWDEQDRKADEDRRKADEDRRKADERFEALMRRIDTLMVKSDRRERELALGLAKVGKRIIDTQVAILAALNGRGGHRPGPRRN